MRFPSVKYILLFLAQAALWNYFNFSPYIFIVFLPAMLFCLPVEYGTIRVMLTAFVTGLLVDFLVNGALGMTSFALVPVAAFRRRAIRIVFGQELFARNEAPSFQRHGWAKFALIILIMTAVYLILYIWVDSAGFYSFGFRALKFALSLLVSTAVSLPVAFILLENTGERWK